jgi:hypothetical protein
MLSRQLIGPSLPHGPRESMMSLQGRHAFAAVLLLGSMTKRCLICEKEIEEDAISVSNATVWTSHGNYGSGVYDPANAAVFLEAFICDSCLIHKKELVEEVVVRQRTEVIERRPPDL